MNDIIKQLAVRYNLSEELVNKIVRSQFEFVKDTMEVGELESVHLHYLGKFAIKPNRLKKLLENGYEIKKDLRDKYK